MANSDKKIVASLKYPTPKWLRAIIRTGLWVSGIWSLLITIGFDIRDFGLTDNQAIIFLKYTVMGTTLLSVIGRFIGEKPVKFDTDEPLKR